MLCLPQEDERRRQAAAADALAIEKQAKEIAALKVAQRQANNKVEADAAARLVAARLAEAQAAHVAYAYPTPAGRAALNAKDVHQPPQPPAQPPVSRAPAAPAVCMLKPQPPAHVDEEVRHCGTAAVRSA